MRSYSFPLDRPPKYHAHTSPAQTRVLDSESALLSSYETESPKDMEPVITSAAFVTLTSAGGINVSEELVTDTRQRADSGAMSQKLVKIGKAFRDLDKKVTDCEENMDTLLILAGLLFLCLFAFCVKVIPSVSTSSDSTTAALPASNILTLWSMSMLLVLVAVRLAFHVKHQLHKNAILDPKFQALRTRYRVRLFRPSGLRSSGVFTKASLLPAMLQCALALFVAGLCDLAWHSQPSLASAGKLLAAVSVSAVLIASFVFLTSHHSPLSMGVQVIAPEVLRVLSTVLHSLPGDHSWSFSGSDESRTAVVDNDDSEAAQDEPLMEGDIVQLLIAADSLWEDDDLLATTLRPALLHSDLPPADVVHFVFKVLEHRVQGHYFTRAHEESYGILDLHGISKPAWDIVVDITADTLEKYLVVLREGQEVHVDSLPPWSKTAVGLLFSQCNYPLSAKGQAVVSKLTAPRLIETTCRHVVKRSQNFADIWGAFRRVLPQSGCAQHTHVMHHILKARFCHPHCQHESLSDWTPGHNGDMKGHVADTLEALAGIVHQHLSSSESHQLEPSVEETLFITLRWAQYATVKEERQASLPIIALLRRPEEFFTNTELSPAVAAELLRFLGRSTVFDYEYRASTIAGRRSILRNITVILARYTSGVLDAVPGCGDINIVRLARRPHWMLENTSEDAYKNWAEWRALLLALSRSLQKYCKDTDSGVAPLDATATSKHADDCLRIVSTLTTQPPAGWTALGLVIPRELVSALHLFLRPDGFDCACTRDEVEFREVTFAEDTMKIMGKHGFGKGEAEVEWDEGFGEGSDPELETPRPWASFKA